MIHKLPTEKKSQNLNEHKIFPMGPSITVHMYCSEEKKNLMDAYSIMLCSYTAHKNVIRL